MTQTFYKADVNEMNNFEMNNDECINIMRNDSGEEVEGSNEFYCSLCEQSHSLIECPDFVARNPDERSEICKWKNICFRCLGTGHKAVNCSSRIRCLVCNGPHHGALHRNQELTCENGAYQQSVELGGI